ncbi:MAG: NAD/NADP octopine/nopaline dehydrogenase family protein [Syntrophaceticus sp.]|nr:NAD/NADP octopine/nopaline dehydrogenase family protein [Syntrophaceticus sp.]
MRDCNITLLKMGSHSHESNFELLEQTKEIRLEGILGEGVYPLIDVTRDVEGALKDADIILVFYVSLFHGLLAQKLAPYLKDGQVVFISPGYAGSLLFREAMDNVNNKSKVIFVEGETLLFSSRIVKPGTVRIFSTNYGHPIAALGKHSFEAIIGVLPPVPGKWIERKYILEIALHNPNLIMHTIGITMNAGCIESSAGSFSMYAEGFTPSIWKIVKKLDDEKMAVLKGIGAKPRSYFEEFMVRTFENPDDYTIKEGFKLYAENVKDLKTSSVNNRYITEDVPKGLGLLHVLGANLNIPTPVCDSIITLAGVMIGADYFKEIEDYWDTARLALMLLGTNVDR